MYNVLDQDGNRITVEKVDIKKHRHLSGRKFTTDEFPSTRSKTKSTPKKTTKKINEGISFKIKSKHSS